MRIKENDKVKVVVGTRYYDILGNQIGRVLRTYDVADGIAIVEFPEGMTVKLSLEEVVKFESKPQETNIPEGAKLITRKAFDKAVIVSAYDTMDPKKFIGSLTGAIVGRNIGKKIFESEDAVYMTRDQYVGTLWDGCNPVILGASVDNQMSVDKCVHVSISAMLALENTIDILFGESEELV